LTYLYPAATKFMNDRIGRLIYHAGSHHMHHRYNPYGTIAGKGSWGPATSTYPPPAP